MKEIVIDIAPTGRTQALHMDEFDLGFLGNKKLERASLIVFNEVEQAWDVILPNSEVRSAGGFPTYEGAREFEIAFLQMCRKISIDPASTAGFGLAYDMADAWGID